MSYCLVIDIVDSSVENLAKSLDQFPQTTKWERCQLTEVLVSQSARLVNSPNTLVSSPYKLS